MPALRDFLARFRPAGSGQTLNGHEPLTDAQRRCATDLARLPAAARALRGPAPVPVVHLSEQLQGLQDRLTHDLRR